MAWPKGKPRKKLASTQEAVDAAMSTGQDQHVALPKSGRQWKFKVKPNWEGMNPNEDNPDRFHIPREMLPEGYDFQWVTHTVYGQEMVQHRADFERHGWTPAHQEDFDGRFDGMFMPRGQEGEINNGGLVLMYRPMELSIEAKKKELRAAKEQLAIKEAALRGGDLPGVSLDTQHESVRNKVSRSWERIAVPTDSDE